MKNRIFIGEFIGSCFLVMIIVGSGIMAENLTNDNALRLTANTLATGAGLFVLITAFANISGAHFNPFVSLAMFLRKKINGKLLIIYIPAQILGYLLGVMLANVFFEHDILELSTKNRDGFHIFLSEIIATCMGSNSSDPNKRFRILPAHRWMAQGSGRQRIKKKNN